MKNKIYIFFVSLVLCLWIFIPTSAYADKNLYVKVFTNVDSTFTFSLAQYLMGVWWSNGAFKITTSDLSGTCPVQKILESSPDYPPNYYHFLETVPQGYKVTRIDCYCDNGYHPQNVFSYQYDGAYPGVYISPQNTTLPDCNNLYCDFYNKKILTPVLIVPGLLGTEMKKGDELLWADLNRMFADAGDNFMDPLQFNSNLMPADILVNKNNVIGVEKLLGADVFDYTDGLISEFKKQGYVEGEDLFTFPYDWRYGASGKNADGKTNSDLLGEKINQIMATTQSDKVDVVAHSLGGLVVKKYVAEHLTNNHINKAVFVGVPNTGALKAVKALLQGDNFGISFGPVGLADSEIKKISQNMPAVYDLLPSQKYYDTAGSFISKVDAGYGIAEPAETDLNYQEFENYLVQDKNLNSQGFSNAENLHSQAFDDFDLRAAGIDLYSIDGCKQPTLADIAEVTYKDLLGQEHKDFENINWKIGDGTVPINSLTNLPIDSNKKYYALTGEHSRLLSQDGARQEIVNLISGSNLSTGANLITQDINQCQLNGKAVWVFSPVDISATDQSGNKMFSNGQGVVNGISGGDYEIFGEHKFLFLPTDNGQTYNINLAGAGEGNFTIQTQDIQNNQVGKTEVFSDIPVTTDLTGQVVLPNSPDGQTTLLVKPTQDSAPETIYPSSTVTLSGTEGQPGFYRSDVAVNFSSQSASYNLDNSGWQKASGQITVSSEGKHSIEFLPTLSHIDFTIDKTAPEAVMEFDPNLKDLKFSANDSSQVQITDSGSSVLLTDQAGNTTELKFNQKNRRAAMLAEVIGLEYNGVPANIPTNSMSFSWSFDKLSNLAKLVQKAKARNDYSITASYDGSATTFSGRDPSGRVSDNVSGLTTIKVSTNKGDFGWSY